MNCNSFNNIVTLTDISIGIIEKYNYNYYVVGNNNKLYNILLKICVKLM